MIDIQSGNLNAHKQLSDWDSLSSEHKTSSCKVAIEMMRALGPFHLRLKQEQEGRREEGKKPLRVTELTWQYF